MQDLLLDRVSVFRNSDVLVSALATPIALTPSSTFDPEVVLEFTIPAGATADFQIVGLHGVTGITETVSIPSTLRSKITTNAFSTVTSITSLGGSAASATIKYKNKSGQPYYMEQTVLSNVPARISKNRQGNLAIRRELVTSQDEHVMFIIYGPHLLKSKDEVLHLDSNDRFMCIDVDDVLDGVGYHHTEVVISLIDYGLK